MMAEDTMIIENFLLKKIIIIIKNTWHIGVEDTFRSSRKSLNCCKKVYDVIVENRLPDWKFLAGAHEHITTNKENSKPLFFQFPRLFLRILVVCGWERIEVDVHKWKLGAKMNYHLVHRSHCESFKLILLDFHSHVHVFSYSTKVYILLFPSVPFTIKK